MALPTKRSTPQAASGPFATPSKGRSALSITARFAILAMRRSCARSSNDLRLRDRRNVLKDILEHAVPTTLQDVVIIFVTVSGHKKGHLVQETYANKIYSRDVDGRTLSAIQVTTAAAICTVVDLLATGQLPQNGFIRQEDIPLKVFLENRFGDVYAKPETSVRHQRFGGSGR